MDLPVAGGPSHRAGARHRRPGVPRDGRRHCLEARTAPVSPRQDAALAVSVLVVTYNHARFVRQALDSAIAQRLPQPFEILVSEDCSTDGTREIVQEYAERHPHLVRLLLSERDRA